jgi:hypothetical protein
VEQRGCFSASQTVWKVVRKIRIGSAMRDFLNRLIRIPDLFSEDRALIGGHVVWNATFVSVYSCNLGRIARYMKLR